MGYWRLFLAHPSNGDKCSASEDTQKMSPEVDLRDISRCQMHACMINALFSVSWATKCAHEAVTRGTTVHKTENNRGTNGVSGEVDYGPIMVQHVSHDLESSKSPAMSESWNNPRSTMLSRVAHMTMLSVVICVMNVWNQSCPTSVASLSPFCDCSCKFIDRP